MIELSLADVAAIVGGQLAGGAEAAALVTGGVEFDSRLVGSGDLFLAVPGEHVDGHDYAERAIERGAVAVIGTRPVAVASIEVADGLTALADLAREVLRRLPQITVVGVTGSSGKTSTKDLLAQVLARLGPTVAPPGSFNNELGHPYTVLRVDRETRFLVTENSARGIGHIRYLTEIAPPRIGVVLNVGSAHLGEFGSREVIAAAKAELVEALPAAASGGIAVLNGDDQLVRAMAARTPAAVVLVGSGADCDVRAGEIRLDGRARASFTLTSGAGAVEVGLQLSGEHQVANALAAAAVALSCGMDLDEVASALSSARPQSKWRMQVSERADGLVVVNDAYNANPESMAAALRSLRAIGTARGARTWAVLGQMAELGPGAEAAHSDLGRLAAAIGITRLVVVGEPARPIVEGASLEGWAAGAAADRSPATTWVPDPEAAIRLLTEELGAGDVVLVKASRAAGLERVAIELAGPADGTGEERA